jgi:hypothetical protein
MITRREWLWTTSAFATLSVSATAAPVRQLRAGPLTLEFDPEIGFIRYVRLGDREVLRGIYAAVRDSTWLTVPASIGNVEVADRSGGFTLTFDADCRQGPIHFLWRGTVTGADDGTLRFELDGEAKTSFQRNRIGFCVLHPLRECVGQPYIAEDPSGQTTRGTFPRDISPHQPVKNLRSISHEAAPGLTAKVTFEGDIFEMEDHRNWTDGNFKTYCTPLEKPFPVDVPAGTRIRQAVELRLIGTPPAPRSASSGAPVVFESTSRTPTILPAIGFGWTPMPKTATAAIRKLRPAHLRVDLHLESDWKPVLDAAIRDGKAVDAPLELAVFANLKTIGQLEAAAARFKPPAARWLIYPSDDLVTSKELLAEARKRIPAAAGPLGGGTNHYFTELNRQRMAASLVDTACYSINPQVHAFDDRSLIENLEPQADTVLTARKFLGATPIAVSPVTLRPRFNPMAKPWKYDDPGRFDPRQSTPFAAAWTVGSVKYLAEAGAKSVTYFETFGPGGCLNDSGAYPLYDSFAMLAPVARTRVFPVSSSDPLRAVALRLESEKLSRLLLVNLTSERVATLVQIERMTGDHALLPHQVLRLDWKR